MIALIFVSQNSSFPKHFRQFIFNIIPYTIGLLIAHCLFVELELSIISAVMFPLRYATVLYMLVFSSIILSIFNYRGTISFFNSIAALVSLFYIEYPDRIFRLFSSTLHHLDLGPY